MPKQRYRADIDGLRAVAVLLVILFHLGFDTFRGGFIGVDVFFVISGFLITRLIKDEIVQTHRFSFSSFYVRRARRLFPALFCTHLACLVFAVVLFSPQDLQRFGGALVSSSLSISNFYFWSEAGYFDTDAVIKPLLHTWSLSVEEQFYLFWPIALVFLLKAMPKYGVPIALFFAGVCSLYLNIIFEGGGGVLLEPISLSAAQWVGDRPSTIFYLAPFRVYEFAIGGLFVWLDPIRLKKGWHLEPLLVLGLGLIVYAALRFDAQTSFPSYNALLPCLGAALVLYSGQARYVGMLLRNPVSVGIGRISYSLYLVHWPIIVFWRYYTFADLNTTSRIVISIASLAIAVLMYRLVERTFRKPREDTAASSKWLFWLVYASLAMLLIVPSAHTWANKGWPGRLPAELSQSFEDMDDQLREYWDEGIGKLDAFSDDHLSVVVIGDSFAIDVANMLDSHPDTQVYFETSTGHECYAFTLASRPDDPKLIQKCADNRALFDRSYPGADLIVLADQGPTWYIDNPYFAAETLANIKLLRDNGFAGPVVIYGERPIYNQLVYQLVLKFGRLNGAEHYAAGFLQTDVPEMRARIEKTIAFYMSHDVHYFSPVNQLCDDSSCQVLTPNNKQIYFDKAHFTFEGDEYLKDEFVGYLRNRNYDVDALK